MSSSRDVAAKIAKARLTEKLHRVDDAQSRLRNHAVSIEHTRQELSACSGSILTKTEAIFKELQDAIDRRRSSILERIKDRLENVTSALSTRKQRCESLAAEADKVSSVAAEVMEDRQSVLIRQYSAVSQIMEDTFIRSLVLLDEPGIRVLSQRLEAANECDLDCSSLLIELDGLLGPVDALVSEFGSVIDAMEDMEPLPVIDKDALLSPASIRHQISSGLSASSLSLQTTTTEQELQMASDNNGENDSQFVGLRVPYLQPSIGDMLDVVVTLVSQLDQFTAQLYGQEIVHLSHQLRECMSEAVELPTFSPEVGGYCCGLYSEDQCWYRSRILGVNAESSTATVVYIDYGNHEEIPFSMIRPLPTQFCSLPAQALSCSLHSLDLPLLEVGELTVSLFQWLSVVLTGARIHIIVNTVGRYNDVQVEAFVPSSVFCTAESLALLQRLLGEPPIGCQPAGLPSSVRLASFLKMLCDHYITQYTDQSTPVPSSPLPSPHPPPPHSPVTLSGMSLLSHSSASMVHSGESSLSQLSLQGTKEHVDDPQKLPSGLKGAGNNELAAGCGTSPVASTTSNCHSSDLTPVLHCHAEITSVTKAVSPVLTQLQEIKGQVTDDAMTSVNDNTGSCASLQEDATSPEPATAVSLPHTANACLTGHASLLTIGNLRPFNLALNVINQFNLLVSHVVSPSCVYIHPVQLGAQDLLQLEKSLKEFYSDTKNQIPLPAEFVLSGVLCCLQSHDDMLWYRAVVCDSPTSTSPPALPAGASPLEASATSVQLLCVDYGHMLTVPVSSLVVLDPAFTSTAIQCVCCSLDGIKPPTSNKLVKMSPPQPAIVSELGQLTEKSLSASSSPAPLDVAEKSVASTSSPSPPNTSVSTISTSPGSTREVPPPPPPLSPVGVWDDAAIQLLMRLVGEKQLVGTVTQRFGASSDPRHPVLSIQLYDTTGDSDLLINQELVEAGVAEWSTPMANISPSTCQSSPGLSRWDPMQEDFLSKKNCYTYDDEDVGCVLLGYKGSQTKVCRFFAATGSCRDGDTCRFQHLREGVIDELLQQTYSVPDPSPSPPVGSYVVVVVTAIASHSMFYVRILGTVASLLKNSTGISAKHSSIELLSDSPSNFDALMENMDQFYRHQVHKGRDGVYMVGELVASYNEVDGHWYRATVTKCHEEQLEVFYIDVGYGGRVGTDRVRKIQQQFTLLPIQSYQCSLDGDEAHFGYLSANLTKERFQKEVVNKLLIAKVTSRSQQLVLCLKLYDTIDSKDGVLLNNRIMAGEFEPQTHSSPSCPSPPPHTTDGVIVLPG